MDNKERVSGDEHLTQEVREQQVWDRLQNEAIAAQRWRLEQEMEEARANAEAKPGQSPATKQTQPNRLAIVALASFIIISLMIAVVYTW